MSDRSVIDMSLSPTSRVMIISVQSVTNMDTRLTTFAANRISDGPIDEWLLAMAGNLTRASEMINHSIEAGPPRPISRDAREPVDGARPRFGLFCGHASLRTWGADRRSAR